MVLDNFNLISWRTNKMNVRIILMWFLTATVLVGISNADLYYELWEGTSGTLETFFPTTLTPTDTGTTDDINGWVDAYSPSDAKDDYTLRFTGFITLPAAGDWTFYTWSDDGSRLYIEGDMVVDNDGDHSNTEQSGTRTLGAGKHAITVTFYENGGGDNLEVRYEGPGVAKVNIPNSAFSLTRNKAYAPDPADGEWFRYSTDATDLAWTLPTSVFDSNEPAVITCDVLWFGTDPGGTPELLVTGAAVESVLLAGRADTPAHYYWRVDCYDPNGGVLTKTEGDVWTFSSARDFPVVFLDESDGSTALSEQDRIANRDDYLLSLSMDPVVPVSITVVELPNMFDPLTNTREELESYDGEPGNAPLLWVTHSGGSVALSRISSSLDDLEEYLDDGEEQGTGSSDLEIFLDEGTSRAQMIALRFNTLAIPQGATINSAFVEFEVDGTQASGEVHGIVTGEYVDNAPPLVDAKFHLRDRLAANPTIATASFIWTADYAVDDKVPTADFASVIQEIVDRPDWALGNSIVLFLTEDMNPDPADIDFIDATDPWALRSETYVLDSTNWEGVTVTLAAIDDDDLETDPDLITLTAYTSSTDPDWDRLTGLSVPDVIVSITENDCGTWLFESYDFDEDCYVGMGDLAMILDDWLTCTMPNIGGCTEVYRP